MKALPVVAVILIIAWVIFWLALKITSGLLHVLWVVAIVCFILWIIGKLRGKGAP